MASVVLIHGAFNELWGPHELKARWLPAVRDGLWLNGATIDESDVDVCFYGDLFRIEPETLDADEWAESRAGAEELLEAVAGGDTLGFLGQAAGKAAYDRTVAMIAIMAGDPSLADRVQQRLREKLTADTRALVAHSLGTVVAHRTLVAHPEIELDTFITLGSPLGSSFYRDHEASGAWPGSTRRWVNVVARGDRVADTSMLLDRYGDRVEEHRIDNGHRAHDPEPYLNARVTGAAIAGALAQRSE